jgi:hypothetical protein
MGWRELLKDEQGRPVPKWRVVGTGIGFLLLLLLAEWSRAWWYGWLRGE